jgi:hypothetical protein
MRDRLWDLGQNAAVEGKDITEAFWEIPEVKNGKNSHRLSILRAVFTRGYTTMKKEMFRRTK